MNEKRAEAKPTEAELALLRVLWDRGEATVREVHEALAPDSRRGYTTTLKLMQIMAEKRFVTRDESRRSHVYRPILSRKKTQNNLLRDLVHKAFEGSLAKLVVRALDDQPTSAAELRQIRQALDELERQRKSGGKS